MSQKIEESRRNNSENGVASFTLSGAEGYVAAVGESLVVTVARCGIGWGSVSEPAGADFAAAFSLKLVERDDDLVSYGVASSIAIETVQRLRSEYPAFEVIGIEFASLCYRGDSLTVINAANWPLALRSGWRLLFESDVPSTVVGRLDETAQRFLNARQIGTDGHVQNVIVSQMKLWDIRELPLTFAIGRDRKTLESVLASIDASTPVSCRRASTVGAFLTEIDAETGVVQIRVDHHKRSRSISTDPASRSG